MKRQFLATLLGLTLLMPSMLFAAGVIQLPQTGQTRCWDENGVEIDCTGTGQDGEWPAGVVWPDPRFTDNLDGTVSDNLTGLIWLANANCFGNQAWTTALSSTNTLANGACGLDDGSAVGDWRLPNVTELESLVDAEHSSPALPEGYYSFFTNVQVNYWSSSTHAFHTANAWYVNIYFGHVDQIWKTYNYMYVWPVRGGQ